MQQLPDTGIKKQDTYIKNTMNVKFNRVFQIIGLALIVIYLISATNVIKLPSAFARTAMFFLGPFAIIGITSIASKYKPQDDYKLIQHLGHIFLVIAFALFTTMLVVQQAGYSLYESNKELITNAKEIFNIINSVQLGMDISFDIFYCLGILLFSLSFIRLKKMGLVIGIVGLITSVGLLTFNMISFPHPPKNFGLIDLGPLTIIWWVLIIRYVNKIPVKA